MDDHTTRLDEVERVIKLMRTVINELGSDIHELKESVYGPPAEEDAFASPEVQKAAADLLTSGHEIGGYEIAVDHTYPVVGKEEEDTPIAHQDWLTNFLDSLKPPPIQKAEDALEDAKDLLGGLCEMLGIDVEEVKAIAEDEDPMLESDEAEECDQVEVWECPEGNYHVALRFDFSTDPLEALADYGEDEVWNAREYAAKVAYRENLPLYDRTAAGPIDQ